MLILAWVVISGSWSENYGGSGAGGAAKVSADVFQIRRLGAAWRIVAAGADSHLISLTCSLTSGQCRSRPPRPWPHADHFRRVHVSFRLHMGSNAARVVSRPFPSIRLHLFGFHGLHDARIPALHVHHRALVRPVKHIGFAKTRALCVRLFTVRTGRFFASATRSTILSCLRSSCGHIRCLR